MVITATVQALEIVGRIWKNQKHKNRHKILKKCHKSLKIGQRVHFNAYKLLSRYEWKISNCDPFFYLFCDFWKIRIFAHFALRNLEFFSTPTANAKNSIFVLLCAKCIYLQLLKKLALYNNSLSRKKTFFRRPGSKWPPSW